MAAEGQSDTMVCDMEVHMKKRCITEFLHAEKMAPIDIPQCLLKSGCDHSEVVHFSRDNSSIGSPLLVHIFTSAACMLLYIAGENA